MKFKKFDIIYESAMKSIITEAWDRFDLDLIIKVTAAVTNNFQDEWQKAETGKEIIRELMTFSHKRANQWVDGKGEKKYTYEYDDEKEMTFNGDVMNACYNYWSVRAQNGGGEFANECYQIFKSEKLLGAKEYIAPKIGQISWAIWKAMNSRKKKSETNLQKAADMNLDSMFKIGEKVTFTLKVKYTSTKSGYYRSSQHLKGTDEEKWPGVMLDVVAGTKMQKQTFSEFKNCPKSRQGCGIMGYAVEGDVYVITAKVKSIYKEGMTVFFNFAVVDDVLAYGETAEDRKNNVIKDLSEIREEIEQKMRDKAEGDEGVFNVLKGFIPDIANCLNNSDALLNATAVYRFLDDIIARDDISKMHKRAFELAKEFKPDIEAFVEKIKEAKSNIK